MLAKRIAVTIGGCIMYFVLKRSIGDVSDTMPIMLNITMAVHLVITWIWWSPR